MKLTHKDGKFILQSDYSERAIPKAAGFRWNPALRAWWTSEYRVAERLIEHADNEAKKVIKSMRDETEKAIEESHMDDADIDAPAPDSLEYMPFQKAGIAYSLKRKNVLIGDEMGLGKTIQAIGICNVEDVRNILIICPASLKINWKNEFEKWDVYDRSIDIANGKALPETDVVIINYDIVKKHSDTLRSREWDIMIVDECHYLKNYKALRTKYVLGDGKGIKPIPAKRRIFLTGTPILNRPIELWTVVKTIDPDGLGESWYRFVTRYCAGHKTRWGWDVSGASNLSELQERLRAGFMIRRLKSEVLKELPAKTRQVIEIPANGCASVVKKERAAWEEQQKRLDEMKVEVELAKANGNYEEAVERLRDAASAAFAEISKLRHETAIAKIPAVIEYIEDQLENVDKIIVFAHHHDVIDALSEHFDCAVKLTGRENQEQRQHAVESFQNDPKTRVFIGSITAAGVGITLTAASLVVFAELDWVPGNITQAEDRAHRIGQKGNVQIQHLVLAESLDAKMAKTLVRKQAIMDKALDDEIEKEEFVIPEPEPPATKKTSSSKIEELAKTLTDEEIVEILENLKKLSAMCDGARAQDGMGFNKYDAEIGHRLAELDSLSKKQAALGKIITKKYHRQLSGG